MPSATQRELDSERRDFDFNPDQGALTSSRLHMKTALFVGEGGVPESLNPSPHRIPSPPPSSIPTLRGVDSELKSRPLGRSLTTKTSSILTLRGRPLGCVGLRWPYPLRGLVEILSMTCWVGCCVLALWRFQSLASQAALLVLWVFSSSAHWKGSRIACSRSTRQLTERGLSSRGVESVYEGWIDLQA